MSYKIQYSNPTAKTALEVADSSINTKTSLDFPGRNQRGYATTIAENFLHLLENFANNTAPRNPTIGQIWYNTTEDAEDLLIFDGTNWRPAGSVTKAEDQPTSAKSTKGDIWVDTRRQQMYIYNGSAWILVGPNFATIDGLLVGAIPTQILSSDDLTNTILQFFVNSEIIAIISSKEFVPKSNIPGFTIIKPGINISNAANFKFWGLAEKAEALLIGSEVVPASNFIRKDSTSNILNYGINIRGDDGISLGSEGQLKIKAPQGRPAYIYHATAESSFDIKVNVNGAETTLLRADSNGNVGIGQNNLAPEEALDVRGDARFQGALYIEDTENPINDFTGAFRVAGGINIQKDIVTNGNIILRGQTVASGGLPVPTILTVGRDTGNVGTVAVLPKTDGIYDIGYDSDPTVTSATKLRFRNVYAQRFYGNLYGSIVGTVSGNVSGAADRLSNNTKFTISGDITAPEKSFNGNGDPVNFVTTIGSDIIRNKTELTAPAGSDLILVFRQNTSSLNKMTRTTFLSNIPTVPIGAIFPFAGTTLPNGYLLCDGSEQRRSVYDKLFAIIGYTYGRPEDLKGTGTFRLPDLRGRFPIGSGAMTNTGTVVDKNNTNNTLTSSSTRPTYTGVQASSASIVGNTGGKDSHTLTISNLPAHKHDFVGDNGTTFYATNSNTTSPTDTGAIRGIGGTSFNSAQYLPATGNTLGTSTTPSSVPLTNPFTTINYIIYTGNIE